MKLTLLGTRGYIEAHSRRHNYHSALLVSYRGRRILIDCGEDWRGRLGAIRPHAVFVTHAHPDHAGGLKDGAPCPVYATAEAWTNMERYAISEPRTVTPRKPIEAEGMNIEAFAVVHSLRAPAVGYRIRAGRAAMFYVPDVVDIHDRAQALAGIDLFVGDGATLTRPLIRRREGRPFGHTTVRAQLGWCAQASVKQALFTHCGSQIVKGDERRLGAQMREMGRAQGVNAEIAYDGMEVVVR